MNYKDILIRALKTFVQAFIPVVAAAFAAADLTELSNLKTVAYSALISGAAAGISAVWNIILGIIPEKAEQPKAEQPAEETTEEKIIPDDEESGAC